MSTNTIVIGSKILFPIISCDIDPDKDIPLRRISGRDYLTSTEIDELEKNGVKVITNVLTISPY